MASWGERTAFRRGRVRQRTGGSRKYVNLRARVRLGLDDENRPLATDGLLSCRRPPGIDIVDPDITMAAAGNIGADGHDDGLVDKVDNLEMTGRSLGEQNDAVGSPPQT